MIDEGQLLMGRGRLLASGGAALFGSLAAAGAVAPRAAARTSRTAAVAATGGRYNVKDYGASGNGTTDDWLSVRAAISAATAGGGGTVYFPPGTYRISSTVTGERNVSLAGEGMDVSILLFDDVAVAGISYQGNWSHSTALTSDTSEGADVLAVASSVGFAVGQDVYIADTYGNVTTTPVDPKFISRVVAVPDATHIQIAEPMPGIVRAGSGGKVYGFINGMLRGVHISDLTLKGAGSGANINQLLLLTYHIDCVVERVRFQNIARLGGMPGANVRQCRNVVVSQCSFTKIAGYAAGGVHCTECVVDNCKLDDSYGFVAYNSTYPKITNNRISRPLGRGVKCEATSIGFDISGNTIVGTKTAGIYASDSYHGNIENNVVHHATSPIPADAIGIMVSGYVSDARHHVNVVGNTIRNCRGASLIVDGTAGVCVVSGNLVTLPAGTAPTVAMITVNSPDCVISGNVVENWGQATGIHVGGTRCTVVGNVLRNGATGAGTAINSAGGGTGNKVGGNMAAGQTITLQPSDSTAAAFGGTGRW